MCSRTHYHRDSSFGNGELIFCIWCWKPCCSLAFRIINTNSTPREFIGGLINGIFFTSRDRDMSAVLFQQCGFALACVTLCCLRGNWPVIKNKAVKNQRVRIQTVITQSFLGKLCCIGGLFKFDFRCAVWTIADAYISSGGFICGKCEEQGTRDWSTIKSKVKDNLRDYIFTKTNKNLRF